MNLSACPVLQFEAAQSSDDLAVVSQKIAAMDIGDEGRNTLRDAYRAAKTRLDG